MNTFSFSGFCNTVVVGGGGASCAVWRPRARLEASSTHRKLVEAAVLSLSRSLSICLFIANYFSPRSPSLSVRISLSPVANLFLFEEFYKFSTLLRNNRSTLFV